MGVRLASHKDLNKIIELGSDFLHRSVINARIEQLYARKIMLRAINDANMNLWVAVHNDEVVGFLLAVKENHWFSKDKYASDLCTVVHDQHGNYAPSLIRRFVKWAKADPKVKDITLGISSGLDKDGRTGRMYEKLGFTPTGGIYQIGVKQ